MDLEKGDVVVWGTSQKLFGVVHSTSGSLRIDFEFLNNNGRQSCLAGRIFSSHPYRLCSFFLTTGAVKKVTDDDW